VRIFRSGRVELLTEHRQSWASSATCMRHHFNLNVQEGECASYMCQVWWIWRVANRDARKMNIAMNSRSSLVGNGILRRIRKGFAVALEVAVGFSAAFRAFE
jgi:hypothetical protein